MRRRRPVAALLLAGLLVPACSAPEHPPEDEREAVRAAAAGLSGRWESIGPLDHTPGFFHVGFTEEPAAAGNPAGLEPLEGVAPARLRLEFLPATISYEGPHCTAAGQVRAVIRRPEEGQREYRWRYFIEVYDEDEPPLLLVRGIAYQVRPGGGGLVLVPFRGRGRTSPLGPFEPELVLQREPDRS